MASPNTVQVKNITSSTEDKEIKDFFSFCGKITDVKVTNDGGSKSAVVTFEKETAAKTALLLNNTQLGPNQISVTGNAGDKDDSAHHEGERDSDDITQEEKPRSRIVAEYLAHGYVISEVAIGQAIAMDQKLGVTQRFLKTLESLNAKYHATDRAKTADESYGITQRANSVLSSLSSYFDTAANTGPGQKIAQFYSQGSHQVVDIHNEARRLAELKKEEHGGSAIKAAGLQKVLAEPSATAAGDSSKTQTGTGVQDSAAVPK